MAAAAEAPRPSSPLRMKEDEAVRRGPSASTAAVVFLFPPVGWQHLNMGRALFEHHEAFRDAMHACARTCDDMLPRPLLDVLYPDHTDTLNSAHEAAARDEILQQPIFALPALFAVQYSLFYALFVREGCTPFGVVGHSIGDFVAAAASGALPVRAALALVCERARLMQAAPSEGAMFAVRANVEEAEAAIRAAGVGAEVQVAAINGPNSTVVAGRLSPLLRALHRRADGSVASDGGDAGDGDEDRPFPPPMKATRVRASHPDHTPLMAPVAASLGVFAERLYSDGGGGGAALTPPSPGPSAARCLWASASLGGGLVGPGGRVAAAVGAARHRARRLPICSACDARGVCGPPPRRRAPPAPSARHIDQ